MCEASLVPFASASTSGGGLGRVGISRRIPRGAVGRHGRAIRLATANSSTFLERRLVQADPDTVRTLLNIFLIARSNQECGFRLLANSTAPATDLTLHLTW